MRARCATDAKIPRWTGKIRRVEVFRKLKAHCARRAYGHVRICCKVAVDLDRKGAGGRNDLKRAEALRRGEHGIDHDGEPVGDKKLQRKRRRQSGKARLAHLATKFVPLLKLRQKVCRLLQWGLTAAREKRQEQSALYKILFGRNFPAIYVDKIAHRRKEIKRYPGREQKLRHGSRPASSPRTAKALFITPAAKPRYLNNVRSPINSASMKQAAPSAAFFRASRGKINSYRRADEKRQIFRACARIEKTSCR